ncbi:MAG TPA: COR domain-containing protein, partial [Anaerolineales bacterium]|nr:COR domain-containing protein [Anaerolineales bacterium]
MDHKQLLDEIGRAANSKTTFLDLSNLGIYELPIEIGGLIGLESLNLAGNNLAALPREFARLTKLRFLDLRNNKFSDFPATVSSLKNLEFLNLALNNFLALPPSLYRLTNLRALDVSDNKLTTISPRIRNLVNLKSLDLSFNNLSSIPAEIAYPNRLSSLDLRNNHLEQLPVDIANLKHLEYLGLVNNNLNIPPEILDTKDVRELQNYLRVNYSGGRQALNELKIILVGQGSVGKTSLIRRLLKKPFNPQENKTDGIFIYQWMILVGEQEVRLNVWDFGGQEIMHATHQFFLTKRSLYILVLDSRLTQEENRVEYWLKIIQSFGGDSPVLIVGNKIDQHPLDIDRTGLPKKYTNTVGILETSAATGAGINELKAAIGAQVNNLPHVRDLLPETWFSVKTKLEELGHAFNFITHDKYLEICGRNKVIDEISQRTLIGFLHDLGVVLHFQDDPRLEALGILNPQWVTNGVYKILNSHALFDNKGVLTMSMLDEILNSPEYPRGKRLFIVDMMKKFELCYDLEADKTFLVPDLLPKTEPTVLKFAGIAAFEYGYPVLPSSIITRFIVRMNQKIHDGTVWRTGVLLKIGNNIALVKAD